MNSDHQGAHAPNQNLLPEPPAYPEAERELIGSIIFKGALIHEVSDLVESRFFTEESYCLIWQVFLRIAEQNHPLTITTLMEPVTAALGWERSDVSKALVGLMKTAMSPTIAQAKHYAGLVRDAFVRRQLWDAADQIKIEARTGGMRTGEQVLEDVEARLFAISTQSDHQERGFSLSDALGAGLAQAQAAAQSHEDGKLVGVPTGLGVIDRKLGGVRNTDMIVVGARPGMGKTAWAIKVARSAAEQFVIDGPDRPKKVMFFSMEMAADQLGIRMACSEAGVSFERVRRGETNAKEMMRLEQAGRALQDLPIWIDETARLSVAAMRMRARRMMRRHGLGLVIIDYLQLVGLSRDEMREAHGNRVQEMSTITRNIKAMAKDLNVPVIALCQLSREVEKREDKRPQLSDLRESGTIEQDADLVAFLYRDVYYLRQRTPNKREKESDIDFQARRSEWNVAVDKAKDHAEFIIAKNRHGSLGTLALKFTEELMLFIDDSPGDATQTEERRLQLAMDLMNRD